MIVVFDAVGDSSQITSRADLPAKPTHYYTALNGQQRRKLYGIIYHLYRATQGWEGLRQSWKAKGDFALEPQKAMGSPAFIDTGEFGEI